MYCNFYGDDITIVSSLVLTTKSVSAVFCPAGFFYNSQVLNCIASYEISEQVQQANVFKGQTLTFHVSTYRPNSFKHLSHHMQSDCMRETTAVSVASVVETTWFLVNNSLSTMSKLYSKNILLVHHTLDASQTEWHLR